MMLLGVTKQAALEKELSAYCLRNVKQLLCVWGDSNACHNLNNKNKERKKNTTIIITAPIILVFVTTT